MQESFVLDKPGFKVLNSPGYNFVFDKTTGFFARWGETKDDDPTWSPFGPEILDLEISTGKCTGRCRFCYKENGTPKNATKHMTLETFKEILNRMPKTLTQIAFGITDVRGNPDFFNMMRYARDNGIAPNYTTHGLDMDDEAADLTAELCGAVAVSVVNENKTFETVEKLTSRGMQQVNIHFMISEERMENAHQLVVKINTDNRLRDLNAIVFLQYKPKGGNTDKFSVPSLERFKELVQHCEMSGVRFGFDSCTAPMYEQVVKGHPREKELLQYAEPCESALFSSYVNVDGKFFPCSFAEGRDNCWGNDGIDVLSFSSFHDVWMHSKTQEWRKRLLDNQRCCPLYQLGL